MSRVTYRMRCRQHHGCAAGHAMTSLLVRPSTCPLPGAASRVDDAGVEPIPPHPLPGLRVEVPAWPGRGGGLRIEQRVVPGVAKQLGVGAESVRRWGAQAQIDAGRRPETTSAESEEINRLKARALIAPGAPDRPRRARSWTRRSSTSSSRSSSRSPSTVAAG
ncbi:hypothetical protein ACFQW5_19285 [Tsukamurella soli]|uniref:hypothetical protein n=1 Tax=Tsukamurella soli TaxID=644556 RepID=UPI0031EC0F92